MPKRKAVKKVSEVMKTNPYTSGFRELCQAMKDTMAAGSLYVDGDIGGCLNQIEFALQQLEIAKEKMMKI